MDSEGKKVTEYRDKVEEEYQPEADTNAEESWKLFKKVVMRAAEDICGATKGGKHLERETWWWNEELEKEKGCIQEMAYAGWTK